MENASNILTLKEVKISCKQKHRLDKLSLSLSR